MRPVRGVRALAFISPRRHHRGSLQLGSERTAILAALFPAAAAPGDAMHTLEFLLALNGRVHRYTECDGPPKRTIFRNAREPTLTNDDF